MDEEKLVPDLEFSGVKTKNTQRVLSDTLIESVDVSDGNEEGMDSGDQSDTDSDSDSDSEYECHVCQRKISGYIPFKQHQKGKKHAKAVLKNKKEKKLLEKDENSENEDGDAEYLIQEPFAVCKVCDKKFNGPESYQKHLKSKIHKRKLLETSILEQVKENGEINADKLKELIKSKRMSSDVSEVIQHQMTSLKMEDDDEASLKEYECKECEKEFTGLKPFTQHLLSKSHMKRIEKNKLMHKIVPEESKDNEIANKNKEKDISTLIMEDDILVCKLCSTSFGGPENAMQHLKSKKHLKNIEKYARKLEKKKKKDSELLLDKNEREEPPEKENLDRAAKQELQLTTVPSEISDNSEKQEPSASGENKNELINYEHYKIYKDLMNSLPQKDRIIP